MAEQSVVCRTLVAKARDMGMTVMRNDAMKAELNARQATGQGNISRGCRSKVVELAPPPAPQVALQDVPLEMLDIDGNFVPPAPPVPKLNTWPHGMPSRIIVGLYGRRWYGKEIVDG